MAEGKCRAAMTVKRRRRGERKEKPIAPLDRIKKIVRMPNPKLSRVESSVFNPVHPVNPVKNRVSGPITYPILVFPGASVPRRQNLFPQEFHCLASKKN
jgi:hypothetical protein